MNGTSERASPIGLPTFSASRTASSSAFCSIRSASLRSIRLRSPGVVSCQVSKAAAAASTARSTSFSPHLGTRPITSSLTGLMIGSDRPSMASTIWPFTKFL